MDLTCKFWINKIFPTKTRTVFYKNRNLFLREAIIAVILLNRYRVKFKPVLNNPALRANLQ